MMRLAAISLIFAAVIAYAEMPPGIPQNCQAPLAHDLEMTNIPYLLGLDYEMIHITRIDRLPSPDAYQYAPGKYKIACSITVHWSNGIVDTGYVFSAWEDRFGNVTGSYGRSY